MNEGIITRLQQLIDAGACLAKPEGLSERLNGLAHPGANGQYWVMSQRLLSLRSLLNSNQEWVAAVLATEAELRLAWCRLMAARCKEAGELTDPQVLVRLVSQLNGAAEWVDACLDTGENKPSLHATGFAELERRLFACTAEQSQATPIVARVLAAASQLLVWQAEPLPAMSTLDLTGTKPNINWCRGRLINPPGLKATEFQYVLGGTASNTAPVKTRTENDKTYTMTVMDWVLGHPWAYLLALIVYEQNVWQVEAAGALLLELPNGQAPQQPTEVQVLVANAEGDELYCGTLGAFVLKVLSRLDMAVFPADCNEAQLNAGLAQVIGDLLTHKVWRYVEGLSGEQGYYQIHPDFSDACYGRKGQPSFSRFARPLRQAVRSTAVQWRNDRQVQGSLREGTANLERSAFQMSITHETSANRGGL